MESSGGSLATIVPKHELIEVNLKLALAHTVIGADELLLQVASRSISKRDRRFCAVPQFRAKRLYAGYMFKAGLLETVETLEAVRVDGRTGCDVPGEGAGRLCWP